MLKRQGVNLNKILDNNELYLKEWEEDSLNLKLNYSMVVLLGGLLHYFCKLESLGYKIYFVFGSPKTNVILTEKEKEVLKNDCKDCTYLNNNDTVLFIKNSQNIQFLKKNQHKDISNIFNLESLISLFVIPNLDINGFFYHNFIICLKKDRCVNDFIKLDLKLSDMETIIPYNLLSNFILMNYLKFFFNPYNNVFSNGYYDINPFNNSKINDNFKDDFFSFYYINMQLCMHFFYSEEICNFCGEFSIDTYLINNVRYFKWGVQLEDGYPFHQFQFIDMLVQIEEYYIFSFYSINEFNNVDKCKIF